MAEARYKRTNRTLRRVKKALDRSLVFYFKRVTPIFNAEMGERLARARVEMGLNQAELGKKFGMSQSDIYRLESGKITRIPLTMQQFKDELADHFGYVFFDYPSFKYKYKYRNKSEVLTKGKGVKRLR